MAKTKTHTRYTPSALQKAFEAYGSAVAIAQFLEPRGGKPFPFTFEQFITYNTLARQEWEKMKKHDEPDDHKEAQRPAEFVPSLMPTNVLPEKRRSVEFTASPMAVNVFPEKRKQPHFIQYRDGSWTVEEASGRVARPCGTSYRTSLELQYESTRLRTCNKAKTAFSSETLKRVLS